MSQLLVRYEDFVIRFSPGPGGGYNVQVESPQGPGDHLFAIPESLRELAEPLAVSMREGDVRDAVPRNRKTEALPWEIGAELFRALFQGDVLSRFEKSSGEIFSREEEGLRILIEVDPRNPELAPVQNLPWEFLYDPGKGDFFALDRKTPVVRCLRVPRKRRPAPLQEKRLRILALSASPIGCPPLDLERERRNLEEAWKGPIVPLQKTGREEIHQVFRKASIHVLHYMGHGSFDRTSGEGTLLLEGKDGAVLPVNGRVLGEDLKRFQDLRLVVLNACHTGRSVGDAGPNPFAGVATALVMGGIPAVIAMSQPISDPAAVAFSQALYERLAAGDPVEAALADARLAIHRTDGKSGEWGTPILFLRPTREGFPRWLKRLLAASLAASVILAVLTSYFGLSWEQERRSTKALRSINRENGLLVAGSREEARASFLRKLEADPDNAVALANLSVLEEEQGHYQEALDYARKAVRAAPGEAVYHYNLGSLLARLGRSAEALESLREALRLKPDYGEAYNETGNLYLDLDRLADARKEFEAGLRVAPALAPLHKNLARVDLTEERIDDAIRHLETALHHYEPKDRQGIAEAYYWLATAHARAGRGDQACRYLGQVRPEAGEGHWVIEADRLAQQIPCQRVS